MPREGFDDDDGAAVADFTEDGRDPSSRTVLVQSQASNIFDAARDGDMSRVRELLSLGIGNVGDVNENDETALWIAAANGHIGTVVALNELGEELNSVNKNGETALLTALRNGHFYIANYLIESGASIDLVDEEGASPFDLTIEGQYFSTLRLLVGINSDFIKNFRHHTDKIPALIDAVLKRHDPIAKGLLKEGLDVAGGDGFTALNIAIANSTEGQIRDLLDAGTVSCRQEPWDPSLLLVATHYGWQDFVRKFVLEFHHKIDEVSSYGGFHDVNSVYLACAKGDVATLQILLESGATAQMFDELEVKKVEAKGEAEMFDELPVEDGEGEMVSEIRAVELIGYLEKYGVQNAAVDFLKRTMALSKLLILRVNAGDLGELQDVLHDDTHLDIMKSAINVKHVNLDNAISCAGDVVALKGAIIGRLQGRDRSASIYSAHSSTGSASGSARSTPTSARRGSFGSFSRGSDSPFGSRRRSAEPAAGGSESETGAAAPKDSGPDAARRRSASGIVARAAARLRGVSLSPRNSRRASADGGAESEDGGAVTSPEAEEEEVGGIEIPAAAAAGRRGAPGSAPGSPRGSRGNYHTSRSV